MRILIPGLLLLLGACDHSPTASGPIVLTAFAGNGQTVMPGNAVPIAPAVIVTRNSLPVAGVDVTFIVPAIGIWLEFPQDADSNAVVTSGADGVARLSRSWFVRTSVGPDSMHASAVGAAPVTFIATVVAGPAFGYLKVAGDGQTAPAGSPLAALPAIKAVDAFGNGVPGMPVSFIVTGGGGALTGGAAVTGANGVATPTSWILGSTPGANTVTAFAQTAEGAMIPYTFTETGLATASAVRRTR